MTATASRLCARLGDKLERIKSCSRGTTAVLPFLPIGPADDEPGSVAASEKAGLARFPAAALIAPLTDLRTLFRAIVPALPGPIGHPA